MKSKIKSLLDTGDILSPGRSRNTTGAKTAAIDTFGVVNSLRNVWREGEMHSTYPILLLGQSSPHLERTVDKCNVGTL